MRQFLISFFVLLITASSAVAQEKKVHMDVSLTAGTTGIGGEIGVQPLSWMGVRVGGTYMPRVNVPRKFLLQVGDKIEHLKDENGSPIDTKFGKMAEFLEDLTGHKVDQHLHMNRRPVMDNFKFMLDFYPLRNKHWHATAGFYAGGKHFITGENDMNDAATLVGVSIYNTIYCKVLNGEDIYMGSKVLPIPASVQDMIRNFGMASVDLGVFTHDILDEQGNVIRHEGDQYYVEPDGDCMVTARCKVNKFRPYVGIGYTGTLTKRNDHWKVGFDIGSMFWGGHPTITTMLVDHVSVIDPVHKTSTTEYKYFEIDLTRDVNCLKINNGHFDNVQKEVNFIKALKVYPVLELKIVYNIF